MLIRIYLRLKTHLLSLKALVCVCASKVHISLIDNSVNQLPQPLAVVGPPTCLRSQYSDSPHSGVPALFLGRPLNDRCLAVSQAQP